MRFRVTQGRSITGTSQNPILSVVIPVYFNEGSLEQTATAVRDVLEPLVGSDGWELIFVDDGSEDGSLDELRRIQRSDPRHCTIVKLTRNFGQVAAILAGFHRARGECCVVMSADLQDPPELIGEMFQRWRTKRSKIVLCTRIEREDSWSVRLTSRWFYRLMGRYAIKNMPEGGFDFFLLDRVVINHVNRIDEKNTFLQGQILWLGYRPEVIPYKRQRRLVGRSRWSLGKKLKYFVDGFVTYTVAPIRLITVAGFAVSILSFSYAGVIVVAKLVWNTPAVGWAPIMVSILMLSGVQLTTLGILGEYLWRDYYETRRLPTFVVEETSPCEGAVSTDGA